MICTQPYSIIKKWKVLLRRMDLAKGTNKTVNNYHRYYFYKNVI